MTACANSHSMAASIKSIPGKVCSSCKGALRRKHGGRRWSVK